MSDQRDKQAADASLDQPEIGAAAKRALAEAAERRAALAAKAAALAQAKETNGRGGLDPVRYDDWEVKGIASDFS
jgi:hypothetical protein